MRTRRTLNVVGRTVAALLGVLLAGGGASAADFGTPVPHTQPDRVNPLTNTTEIVQSIAPLNDGGYVVVWERRADPPGPGLIYASRYDANGVPTQIEFLVATNTAIYAGAPSVAGLTDGGFAVSWTRQETCVTPIGQIIPIQSIFVRRYSVAGVGGAPRLVRRGNACDPEAPYSSPHRSSIAALDDGGFVIVWTDNDTSSVGIFGRVFSAASVGGQVRRLNNRVSGQQTAPRVAGIGTGGFVVAWSDWTDVPPSNGGERDVYVRRFTAGGLAVAPSVRASRYHDGYQLLTGLTRLANGGFAVTWNTVSSVGYERDGVRARAFDENGSATTNEISVFATSGVNDTGGSISPITSGGFVVSWRQGPNNGQTLRGRRFSATGQPVGGTFETTGLNIGEHHATTLADGKLAFISLAPAGLFHQLYRASGAPLARNDTASTDSNTAKTINVLANDGDPDKPDTLTITSATATTGAVTILANGTLRYRPVGCSTTDTINYTITDGSGNSSSASVAVTIALRAKFQVTPATPAAFSGPVGGPFTPGSAVYAVKNIGCAVGYLVANKMPATADWFYQSYLPGNLDIGATRNVTAVLNATAAAALAAGSYAAEIEIFNNSVGAPRARRSVTLDVTTP